MTKEDLFQEAFNSINAFKRHRVKAEIERRNKDMNKAQYHELKQYKEIDHLELLLRALQRENYQVTANG